MIVSVATVGVEAEVCLVRGGAGGKAEERRRGARIGQCSTVRSGNNSKRWDMSSAAARQAGWRWRWRRGQ